jgi:hypothetical protein
LSFSNLFISQTKRILIWSSQHLTLLATGYNLHQAGFKITGGGGLKPKFFIKFDSLIVRERVKEKSDKGHFDQIIIIFYCRTHKIVYLYIILPVN